MLVVSKLYIMSYFNQPSNQSEFKLDYLFWSYALVQLNDYLNRTIFETNV